MLLHPIDCQCFTKVFFFMIEKRREPEKQNNFRRQTESGMIVQGYVLYALSRRATRLWKSRQVYIKNCFAVCCRGGLDGCGNRPQRN